MTCYNLACKLRHNSYITVADPYYCSMENTCPSAVKQPVQVTISDKTVALKFPTVSYKTTPLRTE